MKNLRSKYSRLNAVLIQLIVMLLASAPGEAFAQCMHWVQRTDVGTPGQRAHHAMAYDSDRGVTVFFGGEIGETGDEAYYNDTWEYDGVSWKRITINSSSPAPRSMAAMAYDPVNKRMVLKGGSDGGDFYFTDTWVYQGNGTVGTWQAIGAPNTRGRQVDYGNGLSKLVWDSSHAQMGEFIFFVPDYYHNAVYNRGNGGIAFDPGLGKAIVAGGYLGFQDEDGRHSVKMTDSALAVDIPTRQYTNLVSLPSPRVDLAMAYDSLRKRTVIAGGVNGQDGTGESVLEYDSAHPELGWQAGASLPPGLGRASAAMVFDEKRGVMVLMGGSGLGAPNGDEGGRFPDTWELVPVPLSSLYLEPPQEIICAGDTIIVTAHPGDPRPLKYQWYQYNSLLPGQTNVALNVTGPFPIGLQRFTVKIKDECGNVFSASTDLQIHDQPFINDLRNTASLQQCPGGAFTAKVGIVPDLPTTYQWFRDTNVLTGQTSDTLSLTDLKHEDTGHYHVTVGNHCGTNDSDQYGAPFGSPLPHINLQVGVTIPGQPTNALVNPCDPADFTVTAQGIGQLHYQWRMNETPLTEGGFFSGTQTEHLHISPALYDIERSFDVVITDDCGPANAVTSAPARLILPTPPWVKVEMKPVPPSAHNRYAEKWVMAYDENRQVTVMYGGSDGNGYQGNSLWEYDGNTWKAIQDSVKSRGVDQSRGQQLFNGSPPVDYAMVYNPDDQLIYLMGEYSGSAPIRIWTWDGRRWKAPYNGPVEGGHGHYRAVYDRQHHKILMTRTGSVNATCELLIYDPASNTMDGPRTLQPPLEGSNSSQDFWVYDEYRQLTFWYQNDGVNFGPKTMWALKGLTPALDWIKLTNTPAVPDWANIDITYDPVRQKLVTLGAATKDQFGWRTATRAFPADPRLAVSKSDNWEEELPEGPPRNPAGAGFSPSNSFLANGLVFDRRRRAFVAPGYDDGLTSPTWTSSYEARYLDAVTFDAPPSATPAAAEGGAVTLTAQAFGYGTLGFQWRHNGTPVNNGSAGASSGGGTVSGANGPALSIQGLTASDIAGDYDVVVTNKCGPTISSLVSLTNQPVVGCDVGDKLLAYLKFNDDYSDASGNSADGAAVGSPTFETGILGKAVHIVAGVDRNDYVTLHYPAKLKLGTNDFTIAFWAKINSQNSDEPFISNKNWNSGDNPGFTIATEIDGMKWNFRDHDKTSTRRDSPHTSPQLVDHQWHHIAVAFGRADYVDTYVDGALVSGISMAPDPGQPVGSADTDDLGMKWNIGEDGVGNYADSGSKRAAVDMLVDDLAIWGRKLSDSEVECIATAGLAGNDISSLGGGSGGGGGGVQISGVERSGSSLVIHVADSGSFQLQTKTNLTDAAWINFGAPSSSGIFTVPIMDNRSGFFRLQKQ